MALVLHQPITYSIAQINGQIVYSPNPEFNIPPPPKGTEIFVGRIPKNVTGNYLFNIFLRQGNIYQFRLMVDFLGRIKGYAFVSYFKAEEALKAIKSLNNTTISRSVIVVTLSLDNRRLFLGGTPRDKSQDAIKRELDKIVEGVAEVITYADPLAPHKTRGYAFVEFTTHAFATLARRSLGVGNLVMDGKQVNVDWAEPLPKLPEEVCKTLKRIYLSNLPVSCNCEDLCNLIGFETPAAAQEITRIHKELDYAFVHFYTRTAAEEALSRLQGMIINEKKIRVEWARPVEFSKQQQNNNKKLNHLCRSVPPNMRRVVESIKRTVYNNKKMGKNILPTMQGDVPSYPRNLLALPPPDT